MKIDETNLLIEEKMMEFLQYDQQDDVLLQQEDVAKPPAKRKLKNFGLNTDHSVVIIGWGEDAKSGPYWIVRNSFGKDWGMDGDFHVGMGNNDYGIEGEISAFEVRRCDPRHTAECEVLEAK